MKIIAHCSPRRVFPLLFLGTLSIYLGSCDKTKDLVPQKNEKLYGVTFTTTGFSIKDEPMKNGKMQKLAGTQSANGTQTADAVQSYIEKLDYFLYDETHQLRRHATQLRREALPPYVRYGELSMELPIGNYKLIVVGSMGKTVFRDSAQYTTAYLAPSGGIDDLFYKEIQFQVTGNSDVNETINLERIVGNLEVKLTESVSDLWADVIVHVATTIRYPFDPNGTYESERIFLPLISGQILPWTTQNFVLRGYLLPDRSGQFDTAPYIEIQGQRMGNIGFKDFSNPIVISPNRKLIIEGSVTGAYKYQHFTVSADSTWTGTDSITFNQE